MRLDMKENIVFPFSDPSWIKKTLIASACQLLVVTAPALVGYQLSVIRQTANGEDDKLPEFENPGALWIKGLVVTAVFLVLVSVPIGLSVALALGGVFSGAQAGDAAAMGATFVGVGLVMAVFLAVMLAYFFLLPAFLLRYAMTDNISSFWDFSTAIGDIKQGFGDYVMILVFSFLGSICAAVVGAVTMGIGLYPASALVLFIQGRMIGNYYRAYFM